MSKKNVQTCPPYSTQSGLDILAKFDGIIEHLTDPNEEKTNYKATKHWRVKWVNRRNKLSYCVLLPRSEEAKEAYRSFFVSKWADKYNLNEKYAGRIYDGELPYKWENLDNIIAAFKDTKMLEAVYNYNHDGSGPYFNKWYREWEPAVKPHLDKFKKSPLKWAFVNFIKGCLK